MSSFHGMWSLGGVLGGITGALASELAPIAQFAGMALATLLAFLLFRSWMLPHDLARKTLPARRKGGIPMPGLYLMLLGFIAFSNMGIEGTMYDWSGVYLAQDPGQQGPLVRAGYIACMVSMVAARFLADGMIPRFGPVRVLQAGGAVTAVGITLACLCPALLPATAGLALVGLGMAPAIPICYSLAGKNRGNLASVAISILSTISFVGLFVSPAGIGFLAHAAGLRMALLLLAVLGISITATAPLLNRELR